MRIVWALDPMSDNKELEENAIEVLKILSQNSEAEIFPIYVFSPAQINLAAEFPSPLMDYYRQAIELKLKEHLERLHLSNLKPHRVLQESNPSFRKSADHLINEAVQLKAQVIVVASHGRSGLARLAFGSFTETLLLRSNVPCLVVTTRTLPHEKFQRILFPTDLSEESKAVLSDVIELAKSFNAKLILYHKIPSKLAPDLRSQIPLVGEEEGLVTEFLSQELKVRRHKAEEWAQWSSNQGVITELIVEQHIGNLPDAINATARANHADLIAVVAQTGAIGATFVGSITREVLRTSETAIWVFHSKGVGGAHATGWL